MVSFSLLPPNRLKSVCGMDPHRRERSAKTATQQLFWMWLSRLPLAAWLELSQRRHPPMMMMQTIPGSPRAGPFTPSWRGAEGNEVGWVLVHQLPAPAGGEPRTRE